MTAGSGPTRRRSTRPGRTASAKSAPDGHAAAGERRDRRHEGFGRLLRSLTSRDNRPILGLAAASYLLSIVVMIAQNAINADGVASVAGPGHPSAVVGELVAYLAATAGILVAYVGVVVLCLRRPVAPSGRAILIATPV